MNTPKVSGALTFFYYDDLPEASKFYDEVMGFQLKLDLDWVKIYKIGEDSHLGLVNAEMGSHKPSPEKPVRLQVMVPDAQAWLEYFREKGVHLPRDSLHEGSLLKIRTVSVKDPGGYTVEVCEYVTPYGQ